MAVRRDRITVYPPVGETVVVDISHDGDSVGTAHTVGTAFAERQAEEAGDPTTLALPATISEPTSFFLTSGGGPYDVSVKLGATEIAGPDETPVTVSAFPAEVRPTIDTAELADIVGGGSSGGSVSVGAPVIRAFPFAFDDPGLTDGVEVYTPAIGDLLIDAWVEVDTAWNGTTPTFDVGSLAANYGWFQTLSNVGVSLAQASNFDTFGSGDSQLKGQSGASASAGAGAALSWEWMRRTLGFDATLATIQSMKPAVFVTADPVKIVVSQTGAAGGADPGATQGAGVLYLVTVTPATDPT